MKIIHYGKTLGLIGLLLLSTSIHAEYGSEANPLLFNTAEDPHKVGDSYTPLNIIKPPIDGLWDGKKGEVEHVILHASLSKSEMNSNFKLNHCIVPNKMTQSFTLGDCDNAQKFLFKALGATADEGFVLFIGNENRCLSIVNDKLMNVFSGTKYNCENGTLARLNFNHVATRGQGESYYRNEITFTTLNGAKKKHVYVNKKKKQPIELVVDDSSPTAVFTGLQLTSCKPGQGNCWREAKYPIDLLVKDNPEENKILKKLKTIKNAVADVGKAAENNRPNLLFVFIDTLRADAVNDKLTPYIAKTFLNNNSMPFQYSISGATNTHHSTYSLLNMRPSFELETVNSNTEASLSTLKNGVIIETFQELGYKTLLFSRPDWMNTFTAKEICDVEKSTDCSKYPASYAIELPLKGDIATYRDLLNGTEVKNIGSIYIGSALNQVGYLAKTANSYIATATLDKFSNDMHDKVVVDSFEKYLNANEDKIKQGGHVFFVYLSGPHSPQVPNGVNLTLENGDYAGFEKDQTRVTNPAIHKYPGLFFAEDLNKEAVSFNKLSVNYATRRESHRDLFPLTYYNQAQLVDNLVKKIITDYQDLVRTTDTVIVIMGDHGEGLGENHHVLHGHRPMQKIIEAPILFATMPANNTITQKDIAEPNVLTVTTMDIMPRVLDLMGHSDALKKLTPYIMNAASRQQCHISFEPNGSVQSNRFIIFDDSDEKNKFKMLFMSGVAEKGVNESDKLILAKLTDYFDNPLKLDADSEVKVKRCLKILFDDFYE
ncbi:MAG: sulfatase-like hydrolase/transferase [Colwellia sp.]|nr:sulfatase-like hydrolase/transferase [Colwellia sp.]